MSKYMLVHGSNPVICLPEDLDQSKLTDITCISDGFRKYIDIETGDVHDCEVYFNQAMQEIQNESLR